MDPDVSDETVSEDETLMRSALRVFDAGAGRGGGGLGGGIGAEAKQILHFLFCADDTVLGEDGNLTAGGASCWARQDLQDLRGCAQDP